MPFNGSGSYTPPAASFPAVAATLIESAKYNNVVNDIATALTTAVTKDGQTTITANLPMAGFRHTGVGNGVARSDYAAMGQAQDGTVNWVVAGGAADALTATYAPSVTALVDGQLCFVRAASANATTTPTFAPNGLTAHTITKLGGSAVVAGEWATDQELNLRYKLASTRWELLNPKILVADATNGGLTVTPGTGVPTITLNPNDLTAKTSRVAADSIVINDVAGGNVPKKVTFTNAFSGMPIQSVSFITGDVATGTTVMPIDDTIPQNTEGDQYMSLAITPTNASSALVIEVIAVVSSSAASQQMTMAVFQDLVADAGAVVADSANSATAMVNLALRHTQTAGSTSATTFKVRIGGNNAGTTTFNGLGGGRLFGGRCVSSIRITELLP